MFMTLYCHDATIYVGYYFCMEINFFVIFSVLVIIYFKSLFCSESLDFEILSNFFIQNFLT
jgi:hypothetical protein